MALPISIARRRTDIGTGWDSRIDEMSADLALIEETTQKFTWDFAVQGGTAGLTIHLGVIPDNAVITAAWYDVVTAITTGAAANLSLGLPTDGLLVAPVTAANAVWAATGIKGTLVGSFPRSGAAENALVTAAGQSATFIKTTSVGGAGRALDFVLAGATPANDLTAGRFNVYVSYYISA